MCCFSCHKNLTNWFNGKPTKMPFGQPMIWREPKDHVSDCYFCLTDVKGFSKKSKHTVKYAEVSSVTKPIPHSEDLPVPNPPSHVESSSNTSSSDDECEDFQVASTSKAPHLISQSELDDLFRDLDLPKEKCNGFVQVTEFFLGNKRSPQYESLINQLLHAYKQLGCNMSLKIHFLHSHLNFFKENLGAVSDEHGERFHQEIASMEKRYQGKWTTAMLADYCWFLIRETPTSSYNRQAKRTKTSLFFKSK